MKQELDITSPIQKTIKNDGYGDIRLLFALGLYNMPALSLDEFKKYDKNGWHSACSLTVTIPTGEYDSASLVNSGINKYSYKPECAAYFIQDKFQLDIFANSTIYSDNKEYLVSKTVEQKNLYSLETRLSYNLNSNVWVSSDFIYNKGGESIINNVAQGDAMDSLNVGVTANFKYKNQILRLVYQKTAASNNDYQLKMKDGVGVAYQIFF